jgi:ribonuclease BN (tRNA processing enzyme)
MCDVVGKAYEAGLSRRGFLGRTGAAAGALAGAALLNSAPAGADGRKPATSGNGPAPVSVSQPLKGYRTKVVLLGTAGGPVWWTGTDRKGISTAVAVGERVYLVDCGEGFGHRFRQTDLAPSGPGSQARTLNRLQGVFLTHLHSDHVVDYNSIPLFGLFSGLQQPRPQPVHAYGPGNRGRLPDVLPPGRPAPPVINPENPTPGTVEMTDYLYQAFATDLNDRMRDSGSPDPRTRFQAHDIALPAGANDPTRHPPPRVAPFLVHEDDHVRVTATLVDHGQVFPSFGYRFDTDDGSVVISGDTAPSENLIQLAQGADVLCHEVIERAFVEALFGQPPFPPDVQAIVDHLLFAHTTVEDVGDVAERAGVRTLVLHHYVPGNGPPETWLPAQQGFSGQLILGEDLMQIGVRARVHAKVARR